MLSHAERSASAGVSGETTTTMTERKVIKAKVGQRWLRDFGQGDKRFPLD